MKFLGKFWLQEMSFFKVNLFWGGHKNWPNLHQPITAMKFRLKKDISYNQKFPKKKLQNLVYSVNAATHSSLCNKFLCVSDCPENDNNHASTYIRSSRPINYNLAKKSGKKIKIFEALNLLKKIGWWEKEHQFQMLVGVAH